MKNRLKIFSWQRLSEIKDSPILILGSREISPERIVQLSSQLLKNTDKTIVWGVFTEKFIKGLENSPQFRALTIKKLKNSLEQTDNTRVSILEYSQANASTIISKHNWSAIIGINGSWHRAFHYRDEYQVIKKLRIPLKFASAFANEREALVYESNIIAERPKLSANYGESCNENTLFKLVNEISRYSFDNTWQTGAILAKNGEFLLATYNKVVPFETYALLYGASKEKHKTPPQDLNHYDTNHAEVEMVLEAAKKNISLKNCSLYINLMPCPICARMLAQTEIKEIVYKDSHSSNYATTILEKAGKTIRQFKS
jgi:dCMP deaminase